MSGGVTSCSGQSDRRSRTRRCSRPRGHVAVLGLQAHRCPRGCCAGSFGGARHFITVPSPGVAMTRGTVFAVATGFVIGLAFGCGSSKPPEASGGSDPTPAKPGEPAKPIAKDELPAAKAKRAELEVSVSTVVVVKNLNNADSVAIADYYARKRQLPAENVCEVRMTDVEEWSYKEYEEQLKRPLQQFLAQLKRPIDYIVLTKGIPIRIHEGASGGLCVDSLVVMMDKAEP